jgi:transposase
MGSDQGFSSGCEGHVGGTAADNDCSSKHLYRYRTGIPWRDLPERFGDPLIDTLTERGIDPVIPPKANRKNQRACDYPLYCERNLIERFFNKLTGC